MAGKHERCTCYQSLRDRGLGMGAAVAQVFGLVAFLEPQVAGVEEGQKLSGSAHSLSGTGRCQGMSKGA